MTPSTVLCVVYVCLSSYCVLCMCVCLHTVCCVCLFAFVLCIMYVCWSSFCVLCLFVCLHRKLNRWAILNVTKPRGMKNGNPLGTNQTIRRQTKHCVCLFVFLLCIVYACLSSYCVLCMCVCLLTVYCVCLFVFILCIVYVCLSSYCVNKHTQYTLRRQTNIQNTRYEDKQTYTIRRQTSIHNTQYELCMFSCLRTVYCVCLFVFVLCIVYVCLSSYCV
jgi:hypothetical protein